MDPILLVVCILLFSVIGTSLGVLTGLTPGIHVNLVAASFVLFQPQLIAFASYVIGWAGPGYDDILLLVCCVIVANAVSHTFLDYIPSVFLGAPDADTALSVLPGHRMLLKGKGYEAVLLSAFGSLVALFFFLCLMFPVRIVMGSPFFVYQKLSWSIPYVLVTVVCMLIVSERTAPWKGRAVLQCSVRGVLRDEHEYEKISELVGCQLDSPLSDFLGRAVVAKGRILRAGQGWAVLQLDKGPVFVEFEGDIHLKRGNNVYLAGVVGHTPSIRQALLAKACALGVFFTSGLLGYVVLSTSLFTLNWYPFPSLVVDRQSAGLFPLFTGLFGISTLMLSLARGAGIPDQEVDIDERGLYKGHLSSAWKGSMAGCFAGWFPGVSNATATVIAKMLDSGRERDESEREFIVAVSAVNTSSCFFTLLALFVLLRARSGVMNAIMSELGEMLSPWDDIGYLPLGMSILLLSGVLAACLGYILTKRIGRRFAMTCSSINYRRLAVLVISALMGMVFLLGGFVGLIVALLATSLGLIPPLVGIKRVHLMGCLILPLVVLFAG